MTANDYSTVVFFNTYFVSSSEAEMTEMKEEKKKKITKRRKKFEANCSRDIDI